MKVALIVPGFSRDMQDWAIPALQALACGLAQWHNIHVFSLRYPDAGSYHLCDLQHHAIGGGTRAGLGSLLIIARTVQTIVAHHRQEPFDLLHAFWVDEPAFVAVLAGRLLGRPVVASSAGGELLYLSDIDYGTQRSSFRRWLIRFSLARANLITAGSPYQKRLCEGAGAPAAKLEVAPLGVDSQRFRPAPQHARPPTVVQAASLTAVKQQSLLLEVVARLRQRLARVQLILAGDGPLRRALGLQTEALGLSGNVTWLGEQPYPRMPAVYQQGHLYLQSSRHESQGMAVLEAMACGLPVLGTPVGLLPEVAALPATSDPGMLAEQAFTLLSDEQELEVYGQAARALAAERFSLGAALDRFRELYCRCIQDGPRAG